MSHTQDSCTQDDLEECAERLALLQRRLDAAHSARDRVHDLMEVVTSVGRDLDLEHVLRHVVQAATTLVRARYGALGVIGSDQEKLVQFLTVGMDDEDVASMGSSPSGETTSTSTTPHSRHWTRTGELPTTWPSARST